MPDEAVVEEVVEEAKVEPDKGLADERAEGTPLKDWTESITDHKLRGVAGKYASPTQFVEAHQSLRQKLSNAIFLPSKTEDAEEVARFRTALGVPENAEGYDVTPPEGEEYDESDQAVMAKFKEIAFEHNVPQEAFAGFMHALQQRATELRQNVAEQIDDAKADAEEELETEWGESYDKNISLATRAAKAHGGDKFVRFLNTTKVEGAGLLGDSPAMVRFLAHIGAKSDEHDIVLQSTADERKSAQGRIDEIHEKYPVGSPEYGSKRVQAELQELYGKVHGTQPITGGR